MEIVVKDIKGGDTGRKVTLPESIFGIENPSDHALYQDVRLILANRRQGTHKAKERGEVQGSNKKPFKQKGTGGARAGHKRSPLWRHGGRIFGPRPRDYGFKLNKKMRRLARASALTLKAREEQITVLESFSMDQPRTREFVSILKALQADNAKVLMVLAENNENIYLSGRNLPNAEVVRVQDVNTYDVLNADRVVIIEEAVAQFENAN